MNPADLTPALVDGMSASARAVLGISLTVWLALCVVAATTIWKGLCAWRCGNGVTRPKRSSKSDTCVKLGKERVHTEEMRLEREQSKVSLSKQEKKALLAKGKHKPGAPAEKAAHPSCLNTLKGHNDKVTSIAFSTDGQWLATACEDMVVRLFKLDNVMAKSFQMIRINLAREQPVAVTFGAKSSDVIFATSAAAGGGSLCKYTIPTIPGKQPEPVWERKDIHGKSEINTLRSAMPFLVSTCQRKTEVGIWLAESGKPVQMLETNQLKNHMAAISPNGRFVAAAAFTSDVKIWEAKHGKGSSAGVLSVEHVMDLKGHKSQVNWLSFDATGLRVVTASKDKTVVVWNLDVRYHLREDPRILKKFEQDHVYSMIAVSENNVLAGIVGTALYFQCLESGKILEKIEHAHESTVTALVWAPAVAGGFLSTASEDKRVKLWKAPAASC